MDIKIINNIKSLGLDMIGSAKSGHPGIVLGAAPIIYTLYKKHMNINPLDPNWINRDRFVMSAGHGSALLYATLYMAGFDISLDDLKKFRQINSITPGHPEYGITPGVDASTGPLGQGVASAVGMAIAGKLLQEKNSLFDYKVYTLVGDGDLMEGISYESLSLAGTLKLNNLIILYDSNNISLDSKTDNVFNENIIKRFEAMNFNTIFVKNPTVEKIDKAIIRAKKSKKPTLIEIKTVIGQGSIYENNHIIHGKPLDDEDLLNVKNKLKIKPEPFYVDLTLKEYMTEEIKKRSQKKYDNFTNSFNESFSFGSISLDDLEVEELEMRNMNSVVLNKISELIPNFVGGSADLASSTKTYLSNFLDINENFKGRNIRFGVREHAMGAILNGLSLSNFYTFGSTFLSFSDYLKPAIRMSALMNLPVTYIFTHDSINIGQDGPTHQPIEQLAMLRSIPNFYTFRPANLNEIKKSWEYIINNKVPSCIVLSRNKALEVPSIDFDISKGAYIVRKEQNLHGIITATGTEVGLAISIANKIYDTHKIDIRVVSVPSLTLFDKQPQEYKETILPKGYKNIVIEALSKFGWEGYVYNSKYLITVDQFGFSGSPEDIMDKLDYSIDKITEKIIKLLK